MQKSKTFKLFSYTEDRCNVRISCSINTNGIFKDRNSVYFTNYKTKDTRSKSFSLFLSHEDDLYTSILLTIGPHGNILNPGQIRQKLIDDSKGYNKKYHKKNKHINKIRSLKYKQNNKEHIKEIRKQWGKNNPDKTRKYKYNRKKYGFNPLNDYFENSHFHHLHIDNHDDGIFIPEYIHSHIWHSPNNKSSMDKINKLAFEWLENNEISQ